MRVRASGLVPEQAERSVWKSDASSRNGFYNDGKAFKRHLRRFTAFANKIIQLWICWQLNPSRIMKPPCLSHSIRFNILRREATGERGKVLTGYHRETFPAECSDRTLLFFFLFYKSQSFLTEGMLEISPHHSINLRDPGNSLEFFAMFQELNVG